MISRANGRTGKPVTFKGTAYDFGHAIAAVQFSLDGGRHWTTYETPGANDYQTMTWTFSFVPDEPGSYELRVRSVNDEGRPSPEAACAELLVEAAPTSGFPDAGAAENGGGL